MELFSAEDLAPEDSGKRKKVYLVTPPPPRTADHRARGALTRQQVCDAVFDAFCNPVYSDLGNRNLLAQRGPIFDVPSVRFPVTSDPQ